MLNHVTNGFNNPVLFSFYSPYCLNLRLLLFYRTIIPLIIGTHCRQHFLWMLEAATSSPFPFSNHFPTQYFWRICLAIMLDQLLIWLIYFRGLYFPIVLLVIWLIYFRGLHFPIVPQHICYEKVKILNRLKLEYLTLKKSFRSESMISNL